MNNINTILFNNNSIRLIESNNEVLMSANDVMAQLGYSRPRDAWYDMKPKVEAICGDVGVLPTTGSDGKTYQMSFLNKEQLITLLLKSNRPEAIPFQKWAVRVLDNELSQIQQIKHNNEIQAAVKAALTPVKNEAYYHQLILNYANYSTIKLRSEAIFHNDLLTDDNVKHRRTDLIRVTPRCIQVWELKSHPITEIDIAQTLAGKGYLSLVAKQFPNKAINFKFTSPFGLTNGGKRALETTGAEDKYTNKLIDGLNIRCKISFESTQQLCATIKQSILKATPPQYHWYHVKYVEPDYTDITEYPIKKVISI
jgi:prophage antirepressor-like protein